jgi:hypothetical protein
MHQTSLGVALQIDDNSARVSNKALQLCRSLCADAPQLRLSIVSAAGFIPAIARCLSSSVETIQSSALAVLAELVDSQEVVHVLQSDMCLRKQFQGCSQAVLSRWADDSDAYAEEKAWINAVSASTTLSEES